MKKIVNLRDLLLAQASDLYNAELQQFTALPVLRDIAISTELKKIIDRHINETRDQVARLDRVFHSVRKTVLARESTTIQSLVDQASELCERCANPEVRDAAIITAIQHINHYEIAGYGASCTYANELNANEIAETLHESLEEEKRMNTKLSLLARRKINARAAQARHNSSKSHIALISLTGIY